MKTAYKIITKGISHTLKTPPYLILFVTDECWLGCKHCFFTGYLKSRHNNNNLTFDELEKVSKTMSRIYFLSLTGGEAFIRDELEEIAYLFIKNNKLGRIQIPTSGYIPELILRKTENILKNISIPFRVDVSLDGTEGIHDYIRGRKGSYYNALNTVKELNCLRKHYSNFDVGVITTLSEYNQDYIEDISGIIEDINPEGEWLVNIARGFTQKESKCNVDINNYKKVSQLINERIRNGTYKGHSGHITAKWLSAKNAARRKVIERILLNQSKGGGCSAGTLEGIIYHDGIVAPCELLDDNFGNIRDYDYDFGKLWTSKKADIIRDKIQNEYCLCTHECYLSVNLLIQPDKWPGIIKERIKLINC